MRITRPRRRELRPRGDDQQYPELRHPFHGSSQQFQRGGIDPVNVFEDNQDGLLFRQLRELCQEQLELVITGGFVAPIEQQAS